MWKIENKIVKNKLKWDKIWEHKDFGLALETSKNQDRLMHRFFTGTGPQNTSGAVCICESEKKIVFVVSNRIAIDSRLVELPRGGWKNEDKDFVQTATRELKEETGFWGDDSFLIGYIYPDSGVIATKVAVVVTQNGTRLDIDTDDEAEMVLVLDWCEIDDLIANGQIRDAITLSALMLYKTWLKKK